jgi:hypothetical protein
MDEGWQTPHEQGSRPGPFPPAGPSPQGYVTPPASGNAALPPRATGAAQVPGMVPQPGPAQVSPASGYAQVPPPPGGAAGFPPPQSPPPYGAPGQEYGQPTQAYHPNQQYGQPTQAFNPNQQYGWPSEGYPDASPTGYPAPPVQPQRQMPTNVYGTPSAPPAQGYDPYGNAPQEYGDPNATVNGADPFAPAPEHKSKRLLLVLALVAAVVVLAAVGTAVTLAMRGSTVDFAINDCVKQSGNSAVKASCSDSNAFKVVNKVGQQSDCPDPHQPFVVVTRSGGKNDVLCLRPSGQK